MEYLIIILQIIGVIIGSFVTVVLGSLSYKMATADPHLYERNRRAMLNPTNPDYQGVIEKGIAIDRKNNKLIETYRLSDSAVKDVLK